MLSGQVTPPVSQLHPITGAIQKTPHDGGASMSWYYEVRDSNNALLKTRSGFATELEAHTAGGEAASQLTGSLGHPGGAAVLSVAVGRKNDS